jgi:hypothetical protein
MRGMSENTGLPNEGLGRKDWHRPTLRKLPIEATAGSVGKAMGPQDDGNTKKVGDVLNFS